jgi:hypothetical protein
LAKINFRNIWPPRFPALSHLDYLWNALKGELYTQNTTLSKTSRKQTSVSSKILPDLKCDVFQGHGICVCKFTETIPTFIVNITW